MPAKADSKATTVPKAKSRTDATAKVTSSKAPDETREEDAVSTEEEKNADGKREKRRSSRERKKSRKIREQEADEIVEPSADSAEESIGDEVDVDDDEAAKEKRKKKSKPKKKKKVTKPVIELSSDDEADEEAILTDTIVICMPRKVTPKGESSADCWLIFDKEPVSAAYMVNGVQVEKDAHRCKICSLKADEKKKGPAYAGLILGSTTTLRRHIRALHYDVYAKLCTESDVVEHNAATPDEIVKQREDGKAAAKLKQASLDGVFKKVQEKISFSTQSLLRDVSLHIICDDQAYSLADSISFRNCLVRMRGSTLPQELPTARIVATHIKNAFVDYIETLKQTFTGNIGRISSTDDMWTRPYTSAPVQGVTAHWVEISGNNKWTLKGAVIGMKVVRGRHNGINLGNHLLAIYDRVGIVTQTSNNLGFRTADNTSSNGKMATHMTKIMKQRQIARLFDAVKENLGCYGHITNLGSEAVMKCLTQTSVVETTNAIWEYDPADPSNRILGGQIDVISVIRTLAVKIQASGQRKQFFADIQRRQSPEQAPLIIPLHNNTRWGSAQKMCKRALELRTSIDVCIALGDDKFGPITTVRRKGTTKKDVPWTAFRLEPQDWKRVELIYNILDDANKIQQYFSADHQPTLYRILPAVQDLLAAWKAKIQDVAYTSYVNAIQAGVDKIEKYINRIDHTPVVVMALVLHPYYKLDYFAMRGGDAGRTKAQAVALKYMEEYWPERLHQTASAVVDAQSTSSSAVEVDAFAAFRSEQRKENHGAAEELSRYAHDPVFNVTKDTDPIEWWTKNQYIYPTAARIALDVLPAQASSVPTERSFSDGKETTTPKRNRLGDDTFEHTQVLKYGWKESLYDYSAVNAAFQDEESADYVDIQMTAEAEALFEEDKGAAERSEDLDLIFFSASDLEED